MDNLSIPDIFFFSPQNLYILVLGSLLCVLYVLKEFISLMKRGGSIILAILAPLIHTSCQSKCKFLTECSQYGVAPVTCRAHYSPPSKLSGDGLEAVAKITAAATKGFLDNLIKEMQFSVQTSKVLLKDQFTMPMSDFFFRSAVTED